MHMKKHNYSAVFCTLISTIGLLVYTTCCAGTETKTPAADAGISEDKTAWNLFATGGIMMYPLALCSCAVVGLAVYQVMELRRSRMVPQHDVEALQSLMYHRDTAGAHAYCMQNPGYLTNVFSDGVLRLDTAAPDKGKASAETAISDAIDNREIRMGFWLNLISVIAAVSPMVGLLGTVSGMIKAFQKIGMGGMGKPEQLAGNIGEALITTATGLVVGIPAMLAFFIFRGKLDSLLTRVSETLTNLIDIFTGEGNARPAYEASMAGIRQESMPILHQPVPQAMPVTQPGAMPLNMTVSQGDMPVQQNMQSIPHAEAQSTQRMQ
jgi:biopolymer transport protein ExbB